MLRPGIKEAVKAFWDSMGRASPPLVTDPYVMRQIDQALLLALATLNIHRDKEK
jgi:hypothetical protein